MAVMREAVSSSLDRFIEETRRAWGNGKNPELPYRIRGAMERMIAATEPAEPWFDRLVAEGLPARELYRDPDHGFILMGHVHPAGHQNQPHDHGPYWVVYGVARGEVEITSYRRTDDAGVPGKATLEKEHAVRLTPGVARPYLIGDIHSTRAVIPGSLVFRFLRGDVERAERCRYNLEKGTITLFTGGSAVSAAS